MTLLPGMILKSLSGHIVPSLGVTTLTLLGKSAPFYVVPDMAHDMLLGIDVLRILQAEIDLRDNSVRLMGQVMRGEGMGQASVCANQIVVPEIDSWVSKFPDLFSEKIEPFKSRTNIYMHTVLRGTCICVT